MSFFIRLMVLLSFFPWTALSLVPIESMILGKNFADREVLLKDPLTYVFMQSELAPNDNNSELLMQAQSYVWNGRYISQQCDRGTKIEFATEDEKNRAKRSMLGTLQYMGLDLSLRAITAYAQLAKFSSEEFDNLISGLIGNYCSSNISVTSHEGLKKNFLLQMKTDQKSALPLFKKNSLFPSQLYALDADENLNIRDHEFALAIESFKSFCSWGGDVSSLRLMAPFVNDPIIMGFIIDQMAGVKLKWNLNMKKAEKIKEENTTVQVACKGLICRRLKTVDFEQVFPKIVGSTEKKDEDYARLWCQTLKDQSLRIESERPSIRKMILSRTLADEHLLRSFMVSLLTGIPSIMTKVWQFGDLKQLYDLSLDEEWNDWARKSIKSFSRDLVFEESVSFERVRQKRMEEFHSLADLSFDFDVNLGEYDRLNQMLGKVAVGMSFKIHQTELVQWATDWPLYVEAGLEKKREIILKRVTLTIEDQLKSFRDFFIIAPWEGDLVGLLASDLMNQLEQLRNNGVKLEKKTQDVVAIPFKIRYGLYALKYLNYRRSALKGDATIR
jgi:hypothetical protein